MTRLIDVLTQEERRLQDEVAELKQRLVILRDTVRRLDQSISIVQNRVCEYEAKADGALENWKHLNRQCDEQRARLRQLEEGEDDGYARDPIPEETLHVKRKKKKPKLVPGFDHATGEYSF